MRAMFPKTAGNNKVGALRAGWKKRLKSTGRLVGGLICAGPALFAITGADVASRRAKLGFMNPQIRLAPRPLHVHGLGLLAGLRSSR